MSRRKRYTAGLLLPLLVAGCGEFPEAPSHGAAASDMSKVPNAVPKSGPRSRYGNPASYTVLGKTYTLLPECAGYHERGIASWYGPKFDGSRTSSGETYDMHTMTAANKVVPIPCYVRVTNLKNGKSVIVKINDRGPFVENRLIDLSYAAASRLDMLGSGTALVDIQAVGPGATAVPPAASSTPAPTAPVAVPAVPVPAAVTAVVSTAATGTPPQLFLQVGAFATRSNADFLVQKLSAAGIAAAFVLPAETGGHTLYKVRVGPLADVDSADRTGTKLAQLGFPDAQVIIP
jgi:rare lipoprotein A